MSRIVKFNQKGEVSSILAVVALLIAISGAVLFVIELMAAIYGEPFSAGKIAIGVVLIGMGIFLEKMALS